MCQVPVVGQHGVLIGPEPRQRLIDEVAQPGQRSTPRRRPPAHRLGTRRGFGQLAEHLLIEIVEA